VCVSQTTGRAGVQPPSYSVVDCRGLVKTLVSGVKTITWGVASCKTPLMGMEFGHQSVQSFAILCSSFVITFEF